MFLWIETPEAAVLVNADDISTVDDIVNDDDGRNSRVTLRSGRVILAYTTIESIHDDLRAMGLALTDDDVVEALGQ